MIKLPPSPRDVPAVKLPSPRSYRSSASSAAKNSLSPTKSANSNSSTASKKILFDGPQRQSSQSQHPTIAEEELAWAGVPAAGAVDDDDGAGPEMNTNAFSNGNKGYKKMSSFGSSITTSRASPRKQQRAQSGSPPAAGGSPLSAAPTEANTTGGTSPKTTSSSSNNKQLSASFNNNGNQSFSTPPQEQSTEAPMGPTTPATAAPIIGTSTHGTLPAASSVATGNNTANLTRSKKMRVVDPKSGQTYHLHADDHSLTDKELHVYHKKTRKSFRNSKRVGYNVATTTAGAAATTSDNRGGSQASTSPNNYKTSTTSAASPNNNASPTNNSNSQTAAANLPIHPPPLDANDNATHATDEEHTLNTLSTYELQSLGETLETASALTEVSYYGRYKLRGPGPFQCIIPTSCRSVEHMAFGDYMRPNTIHEEGVEGGGKQQRDDVESIEKERMKSLLMEGLLDGNGNVVRGGQDPNNAAAAAARDANGRKKGKYTKYDDEGNTYVQQHSTKGGGSHHDNPDNGGGGGDDDAHARPLSPGLSALAAMVSPRISNMAKSFFDNNGSSATSVDGASASSVDTHGVERKYRRVALVVFPNEVKQCLAKNKSTRVSSVVGLMGMKFEQNEHDFQAHVSYVQRGSKAEKMGVRRGDVVSFAVALSNMTEEQNSFLAEKLIKRLESVGMRTSYRELYDIFLSKTTNERPIGMVFRRWNKNRAVGVGSSRTALPPSSPLSAMNIRITDEFEWSTDFLQSLSIKCREYEFEQKVPLGAGNHAGAGRSEDTEEDLPLLAFLPRPNVETSPKSGLMTDYLSNMLGNLAMRYNCGGVGCVDDTLSVKPLDNSSDDSSSKEDTNDFLSNRTLCSLVEQSMGLIFLRRTNVFGNDKKGGSSQKQQFGSGFAVVRKAEGSWSAPCFLSVLQSKDDFADGPADSDEDVKMIVIRKKELVQNLIQGNSVRFSVRQDERANVLVRDAAIIGVHEGRFRLATDFFLSVKVNDAQNQGAYSLSTDHIEASDILIGTISPPEQSVDFYGALQSLELPYSMHSHPVIPEMLQKYSDSDWVEFLPDRNGSTNSTSCGMRTKLQTIAKSNALDVKREIDIFARKFKYYLMDGVPVHRVLSSNNAGTTEEKVLRLTILNPRSLFGTSLELTRKRRPGVSNVGIPSNFSTAFENITRLSRSPPPALEKNLDEEEKKRFFSIETDLSPGPVMMLAKSKKDAMILLCGLKLLLEREKMISY